ncbi:MAG TPA: hypothetical protein VHC95_07040 [Opitutales bacterium]|nr:hypothetical protein [Opitutales bacterium]
MTFTDEHLDSQDCYLRMRRALKRMVGNPRPILSRICETNDIDLPELLAFMKRRLGRTDGCNAEQLDAVDAYFTGGQEVSAAAAAGEKKRPRRGLAERTSIIVAEALARKTGKPKPEPPPAKKGRPNFGRGPRSLAGTSAALANNAAGNCLPPNRAG